MTPVTLALPTWLHWIAALPTALAVAIMIAGSLGVLFTTAGAAFKLLSPFWPYANTIANECGIIGVHINMLVDRLKAFAAFLGRLTSKPAAGFIRVRLLVPLLLFVAACAAGVVAVVPVAATLIACVANEAVQRPGLPFLQFVTAAAASCGGALGTTLESILQAIMQSKDPAVVGYQEEARATLADPAKLSAAKAYVAAHRAEYAR